MGPSDSLSTRRDFTLGLYPPPSPDGGRRGGPPQFRASPSLRALFSTPGASCAPPVLRRSLLPSPRHDGLGHSPFRVPISRGCKDSRESHWARRSAPLARGHTAPAGLLTLRSDAAISDVARSLLHGAPDGLPWRDSHPLDWRSSLLTPSSRLTGSGRNTAAESIRTRGMR
jgi:hypothetical protein